MNKPRTVLLTAFEAFGGETLNPTELILQDITAAEGVIIKKEVLPVRFEDSLIKLERAIQLYQPELVLSLGQAGGRDMISLERVALNVNDARIPDNAGCQPVDACVIEGAPDAYFSRLPIKRMLKVLQEHKIPAHVSNSAGTYVCNHLMFGLLDLIHTRYPKLVGGFIHVPFLPEQAQTHAAPSLPLTTMTKAIELCVAECLKPDGDIKLAAGTTH